MQRNNLIPFNWDEAQKRPEAVVTRNGDPVKLAGYNPEAHEDCSVLGWHGEDSMNWDILGRFWANEVESQFDIFLIAPGHE